MLPNVAVANLLPSLVALQRDVLALFVSSLFVVCCVCVCVASQTLGTR
jgi:hypothetical protein